MFPTASSRLVQLTRCPPSEQRRKQEDQEVRSLQHGNGRWFEHVHQGSSAHPHSGAFALGLLSAGIKRTWLKLLALGVSVLLLFACLAFVYVIKEQSHTLPVIMQRGHML